MQEKYITFPTLEEAETYYNKMNQMPAMFSAYPPVERKYNYGDKVTGKSIVYWEVRLQVWNID